MRAAPVSASDRTKPSARPVADQYAALAEHRPDDGAGAGAEREANADLAPAPFDGVRHDAMEPDRGEQRCQQAKEGREHRHHAIAKHGLSRTSPSRLRTDEAQVRMHAGERFPQRWS